MSVHTDTRPRLALSLTWDGELRFSGLAGHEPFVLDGNGESGPTPTQALASALAGCMAIDVVNILQRGRHPVRGLHASLDVRRAPTDPKRFEVIDLALKVCGDVPETAVERAIALSRDKYCSVWHSMRQDIEFAVTFEIQP
ncbi:MAG: OsmC family protein [Vicinamibacteraceae bacterium]|nr:OsmC family protein [Vicinamibacteraceae bacterium]